jgi:hypothetical protein
MCQNGILPARLQKSGGHFSGGSEARDVCRLWLLPVVAVGVSPGPRRLPKRLFKKADRGSRALIVRAFRQSARNPCSARKIPCAFPAPRKEIRCSPAQGILPQDPRIQGLFGAYFRKKCRVPCKFAARREFSLARRSAPARRTPPARSGSRAWQTIERLGRYRPSRRGQESPRLTVGPSQPRDAASSQQIQIAGAK